MEIDGVDVFQRDRVSVCIISNFSESLKLIIRNELAVICNGFNQVNQNPIFHSYSLTLNEFLKRYDAKNGNPEHQKGMLGELLAHVLIPKVFTNLEPLSRYFNKEDRGVKKGFDVTFYSKSPDKIWYGEVKSGEKQHHLPDQKKKILLEKAKNDLKDKFSEAEYSHWQGAINDVALVLVSEKQQKMSQLLSEDFAILQKDPGAKKHAILVSVLFHDLSEMISLDHSHKYLTELEKASPFQDTLILSVQKSTYIKLVDFLRSEAKQGAGS